MFASILLQVFEIGITFGLRFLVNSKNPKFGIGTKLAKIILNAASESKHNPVEATMLETAMKVL